MFVSLLRKILVLKKPQEECNITTTLFSWLLLVIKNRLYFSDSVSLGASVPPLSFVVVLFVSVALFKEAFFLVA